MSAGGEHVIAASEVIAKRLRAPRAEEHASRRADARDERCPGLWNGEMFGREAIGESNGTIEIGREQDPSIRAKRARRYIFIRKSG